MKGGIMDCKDRNSTALPVPSFSPDPTTFGRNESFNSETLAAAEKTTTDG
jgi:hypothetical protein